MLTKTLLSALLVLTVNSVSVQVADPAQCSLCKSGVAELKVIWEDKDNQDLLALGKTAICAYVPIEDCDNWITGQLSQLGSLIEALDPTDVCTKMTVCALKTSAKVDDVTPVCQACHDSLGELKKVAHDPAVVSISKELGPVICELIEIPFCDTLITDLLEKNLVKVQNLDVDGLCVSFKACDAVGDAQTVENLGDTCSECAMIADLLLKELQDPNIQQEVEAALEEVCAVLPIPNCKETINSYISEIEAILNDLDGKTLCSFVGLCSSCKKEPVVEEVVPKKVGDTCSECTMIAGEIITLLENGEVDSLIKEALGELCTILPIANCEQTLDGYFDELIALIKNLDGKTLCSLLGLCGSVEYDFTQWLF